VPEQYKRNPNISCVICKKPVYRRPSALVESSGKAYCGQKCYGISCRKEIPCLVCGNLILGGLNKKTCSRACSNKHREGIKYKIGRPRDNAFNQRSIKLALFRERGAVCERCGYNDQKILQVHHKDRNRSNNDKCNLEIVCPNCHYAEHHSEKSWSQNNIGRVG